MSIEAYTPGQITHYVIHAIPGLGHLSMIKMAFDSSENRKKSYEILKNKDHSLDAEKFIRNGRNICISNVVRELATIAILVTLAALSIISPIVPIIVGVIGLIIMTANILGIVGANKHLSLGPLAQ